MCVPMFGLKLEVFFLGLGWNGLDLGGDSGLNSRFSL